MTVLFQSRLMEERDREKRTEHRKRAEDILSGRRSPLGHPSVHRSPMPEKSPMSAAGSSPVSPLVSSKREDRPSSVNTNARYGFHKPTLCHFAFTSYSRFKHTKCDQAFLQQESARHHHHCLQMVSHHSKPKRSKRKSLGKC